MACPLVDVDYSIDPLDNIFKIKVGGRRPVPINMKSIINTAAGRGGMQIALQKRIEAARKGEA